MFCFLLFFLHHLWCIMIWKCHFVFSVWTKCPQWFNLPYSRLLEGKTKEHIPPHMSRPILFGWFCFDKSQLQRIQEDTIASALIGNIKKTILFPDLDSRVYLLHGWRRLRWRERSSVLSQKKKNAKGFISFWFSKSMILPSIVTIWMQVWEWNVPFWIKRLK